MASCVKSSCWSSFYPYGHVWRNPSGSVSGHGSTKEWAAGDGSLFPGVGGWGHGNVPKMRKPGDSWNLFFLRSGISVAWHPMCKGSNFRDQNQESQQGEKVVIHHQRGSVDSNAVPFFWFATRYCWWTDVSPELGMSKRFQKYDSMAAVSEISKSRFHSWKQHHLDQVTEKAWTKLWDISIYFYEPNAWLTCLIGEPWLGEVGWFPLFLCLFYMS